MVRSFSGSQAPNTQVKFDAGCSSDDRTPDSGLGFEWDFGGDGTYDATGPTARHRFGTAGTYGVTLRVTDGDGQRSTLEKPITVRQDDDDVDDDGPEYGGGPGDDDGGDD
jgi:hypothetical protein